MSMRVPRRSLAVAAVLTALAGGQGFTQQQSPTSAGTKSTAGTTAGNEQTTPAQNSKPAPSTNSKSAAKKPTPADENAFPEAQSKAAQSGTSQSEASPSGASPAAAAPAQTMPKKPPPASDNAFPEAESEAAQKQAQTQEKSDEKAADSGSATGAGNRDSSSSREDMKGLDLLGDNQSRVSNGAGGTVVDPKLSASDVRVGVQYLQMGDFQGAYSRFKEATAVNPSNADAVFYLAEAARKTAHLDESAENYRVYLQVEPGGSKAKQARKALTQLTGK